MRKKNILNLIKHHFDKNDVAFRQEATTIAEYFENNGDSQLAQFIMGLLTDVNTFMPQVSCDDVSAFYRKESLANSEPLPLPECIKDDILGIVSAVNKKKGINKFLFEGKPGTGKTETVKQLTRLLERELFVIDIEYLIDSKLGQTSKNIFKIFEEINNLSQPSKAVILFDEIDAIAIDRINNNDLREMGRATTSILKGLDSINNEIVLVATTNLYKYFDKALTRRFDFVINFDRYTHKDLVDIALVITGYFLVKYKVESRNTKLLKKIFNSTSNLPLPGELKNLIKTCVAFSDKDTAYDYLRRIYMQIDSNNLPIGIKDLKEKGFTVREIEILTPISRSEVSRRLKGVDNE